MYSGLKWRPAARRTVNRSISAPSSRRVRTVNVVRLPCMCGFAGS
ncbi:hypothetical protein [Amycolatopsis regifaucium]|nr:hypothetical protein [Amycolatopsis regifaucium]